MTARAELRSSRRRVALRSAVLAAALAGVVVAALLARGDELIVDAAEWIRGAGWPGVLVFVALYVLAAVFLVPGSILTLAAGFAWGPLWGVVVVLPTATLASVVAFAVARFLARHWVERKIRSRPRFAAVDRAVKNRAFRVVLLLRLSPVFPYSLLNYVLGATAVSLGRYALASFVGMAPGTAVYVYLGSLVTNASRLVHGAKDTGPLEMGLYIGGLLATVLVAWLLTRYARAELQKELDDGD